MNNSSITLTSPALPQCGSEQDQQPNTIVPPPRRQRKPRSEASTRHTWSKEDNIQLMKLYYQSNPSRSGYRKRLHSLWNDAGLFPSSIQRLADQARSVRNNNLLSDIELLEIQGTVSVDMVDVTNHNVPDIVTPSPSRHQSEVMETPDQPRSVSQRIREIRHSCAPSGQESTSNSTSAPNADRVAITEQLQMLLENPSSIEVKPLRHVNRKLLKEETTLVNSCIADISTTSITDTNT